MNHQAIVSNPKADTAFCVARRLLLTGRVQGLGVRPAIFRVADELGLVGFVQNTPFGVEVEIEGSEKQVSRFLQALPNSLPQGALLDQLITDVISPRGHTTFKISREAVDGPLLTYVPPDRGVCSDCLEEVNDRANRRFQYPFTSCTACGPRFSVIRTMPYERPETSMSAFLLCESCRAEDADSKDRRFHAQTNACPECGPQIWCVDGSQRVVAGGDEAIQTAAVALQKGKVVALRGLGGYQFLADATNDEVVRKLRERKGRFGKPLAVLVDSLETARSLAVLAEAESRALIDASNPIVLARARGGVRIADSVHPHLDTIGLMLPTTPLHALVLQEAGLPLICTSGNHEGDPLEYEIEAAERNLADVCDLWLHHDRPIARPLDDSVVRIIAGRQVAIRLARGLAPLTLDLPAMRPAIALGGFQKSACAASNGAQAVLTPHIGDLQSLSTRQRFLEQLQGFQQLYRFQAERFVHDMHPDYFTARWAGEQGLKTVAVQHHHAHVVAGMLEHGWLEREVLGVAWDGTGYGTDGAIWGGEFLISMARSFERFAHLRPFRLPGGEMAIHEPWRTALSILSATIGAGAVDVLGNLNVSSTRLSHVYQLLSRQAFSPLTTSAGRLFDAAAVLISGLDRAEYEGQPAMCLEAIADREAAGDYRFPVREGRPIQLDWRPLFADLLIDRDRGTERGTMAMRFHRSVAAGIVKVCQRRSDLPVVLAGGVFQNRLLTELIVETISKSRQELGLPGRIPPNDGGLAAGQLAVAFAMQEDE